MIAGHIDHGKTARGQEPTNLDTDRLEDEMQPVIVLDLGFACRRIVKTPRLLFGASQGGVHAADSV